MIIVSLYLIIAVSPGMVIYKSLRSNEIDGDIESTLEDNQFEEVPIEELDAIDIED